MKRNYGVDLLRIVSMCLIVAIHILRSGGLTNSYDKSSFAYAFLVFCQGIAFCCVDCYALISGFVGVKSNYRYYKTVAIWLQVLFYSLIITVIFSIFAPQLVTKDNWIAAFFPVSKNSYWYVTAYICLALFIPFVNKMLVSLSKPQLYAVMTTIFLIFTVYQVIIGAQMFHTAGGYSFLWLLALYIVGGCAKLLNLDEKIKKPYLYLMIIGGYIISFISQYIPTSKLNQSGMLDRFSYVYFSVFVSSFGMLLIFSKMRFKSKGFIKFIGLFAPASFGVYLIHVHPVIWRVYIQRGFIFLSSLPVPLMILCFVLLVAGIFASCALIDMVRIWLFKKANISLALKEAEDAIVKKFSHSKKEAVTK